MKLKIYPQENIIQQDQLNHKLTEIGIFCFRRRLRHTAKVPGEYILRVNEDKLRDSFETKNKTFLEK
jgi:hypothetical protein